MSELYRRWREGDKRTGWAVYSAGWHLFRTNGKCESIEFKQRVLVKETKTYSSVHGWDVTAVVDVDSAIPWPLWPIRMWQRLWRRPRLPRAEVRRG